jgi:hypothetical protein
VSESPVQIFISYARNDNALPPDVLDKKGFVTTLHEQLNYSFRTFGEPRPKIWRDTGQIDRGDQFDQKIADAINASAVLLVVLSPNWLSSSYCRSELTAFCERWKSDPDTLRERIIVVGKRHVPDDRRPSLLQGQVGYQFYALDDPDEVDPEREYFERGMIRDDRYHDRLGSLAKMLRRRAERYGAAEREGPGPIRIEPVAPASKSGRTIFLAKPANDMRAAYDRLVIELRGAGHEVVPDPAKEMPDVDTVAERFVEEALARADASIHLLGEKPGIAPDGGEPIVKFQLARASAAWAARSIGGSEGRFLRIVWAPKVLDSPGSNGAADATRNPLEVLARFDRHVPGDMIEGDTLSNFVQSVGQRLARAVVGRVPEALTNSRVYLSYRPEDTDYALEIAKALQARQISPKWLAYEESSAERVQLHRRYLRECDSVVVCWASASDVWVKATSDEWADWRQLGRTSPFARRTLIAGPPPGQPKRMFAGLWPTPEIDLVVDLTGREHPVPEDLSSLIATH